MCAMRRLGGVFATIQEEGDYMVVKSVLRGGQLNRTACTGDLLLSIDGVSLRGLSITDVKRLIAGEEGSKIRLHFFRPSTPKHDRQGITVDPEGRTGEYFYSSVYRASTELQDIQIALLQEMLDLVDSKENPHAIDNVFSTAKLCSWRGSTSLDGILFKNLCDHLHDIKSELWDVQDLIKNRPSMVHELKQQISALESSHREQISALENSHSTALRAMADQIKDARQEIEFERAKVAALSTALDACAHACSLEVYALPKEFLVNHKRRQNFQDDLKRNIAVAIGASPNRIEIVGVMPLGGSANVSYSGPPARGGDLESISVSVDVMILADNAALAKPAGPAGVDRSPLQVVVLQRRINSLTKELVRQARSADSQLKSTATGRMVSKARLRDVAEFVVNLQSTLSFLRRKQGEEAMTATAHAEGDEDWRVVGLALSPFLNGRSPSTPASPSHPGRHGQISGPVGERIETAPEGGGRNGMSVEEAMIELETEKSFRRQCHLRTPKHYVMRGKNGRRDLRYLLELELEAQIDLCQSLRNKLKEHEEAAELETRTTFLAGQGTGQDAETLDPYPGKREGGWDERWAAVREAGTPSEDEDGGGERAVVHEAGTPTECEEGGGERNNSVDREAELSQMCEEYLGDRAMRYPNASKLRTRAGGEGGRESSQKRVQELLHAAPQMGKKVCEVSGVLRL